MVNFIIDGKKVEAEEGATVLQVARKNGITIPTLCCHESVAPSGACRLCVVEVKKGKRTRIVTSCLYPVDEGIVVETKTERVLNVRRLVMQLLMARCPESDVLKNMAKEMGIEPQPAFHPETDKGKCVLCRLCVKACEDVVGVSAIGLSGRGKDKKVGPPSSRIPKPVSDAVRARISARRSISSWRQRTASGKYGDVRLRCSPATSAADILPRLIR